MKSVTPNEISEARNCRLAKKLWGPRLGLLNIPALRELTRSLNFSVLLGDLLLLKGNWYVTHTGLIRLARRNRCVGIHVRPVPEFSNPSAQRWALKPLFTSLRPAEASSGTAMPIHPMFLT